MPLSRILEVEVMDTPAEAADYNAMDHSAVNALFAQDLLAAGACEVKETRILDLGTGTGCLLLALLHERRAAFGVGIDRSESAARIAGRNAMDLGLADRSAFLAGDWDAAINGRFDLVVSNPPYIATDAITTLTPEVARHEPRAALDGGSCGLTAYRAIIAALPRLLLPGGAAVLELGAGQSGAVAALSEAAGFRTEPRADLSGTARAMILHTTP
jgi:release factor glutamine methyltransferase